MKTMIFFIFATLVLSASGFSQTKRLVEFQELGLSFETPNGWTGKVLDDYYVLGHETIPGLMILTKNETNNAIELKRLALQGISDDGIQLSPKGEFKTIGNTRVEGFYEGLFDGMSARVFAIGIINELGDGLNIFVVTEKGKFSETHVTEAKKLAATVKFSRQKETPNTKFWKDRIVGKQLKYIRTTTLSTMGTGASGASTTKIIRLFTDGTFTYNTSADTFGDRYESGKSSNDGAYKIYTVENKTYLQLNFKDEVVEYELSRSEEDYTLLDGVRVLVLDINSQ